MNRYSLLARDSVARFSNWVVRLGATFLYLLDQYSEARMAFVDLASTVGYVGPRDLTFNTQVHMEYGSIPDLVGTTEEGTNVLLVESKFWASLTPNQPTGYLNRLPQNGDGMVLFIAPERRYEELWQQLVARCNSEGFEISDETGESSA